MAATAEGSVKTRQQRGLKIRKFAVWLILGWLVFGLGVVYGRGGLSAGRSVSANKGLPANLDYSSVEQVYDSLRAKYDGQLSADQLLDGMKAGLVKASGDPYTEYMSPKEATEFNEDLSGTFTGIGAELGKGSDGKTIVIISPIDGFPAAKAGLRAKDVIAEINGKSAYDIDVSDAVKQIRGEKGTKVKLKIVRGDQTLDFEITRDQITIPSVEHKILDGNIGYLKISRFAEDTASLSKEAADSFKQAKVKGVILDLRGDPGGLLDAAVNVSSLWLPSGKTVLLEKRDGKVIKTYKAQGDAILEGTPTVVLIDAGSASASEITAGALRDNKAASLLGEKSFGKGSVQQVESLYNGGILKVTMARWYTPNDKNIDKAGIKPDQEVKRTEDDYRNNKDPQLEAATAKLK